MMAYGSNLQRWQFQYTIKATPGAASFDPKIGV
jgi:hypothetical protein